MASTLPPLHALRVFEVAARLMSFTRAAAELCLTQGAISRQIRQLEDDLGKPLFVRLTRKIELTEDGRELLAVVQGALREIERAATRIRSSDQHKVVTVHILPTLASLWLMPQLAFFTSVNKSVEVRIVTTIEPVSFAQGTADIAVTCGPYPGRRYTKDQPRVDLVMVDDWAGVEAQLLFPDRLVPVMSRRFAQERKPIATAADLLDHRLIHTASRKHAWPDWLRANGIDWRRSADDIDFGHFFMSLQAAREGQGIAIVPTALLRFYEARHELVCPVAPGIASAGEYYVITHARTAEEDHVRTFKEWLIERSSEVAKEM